MAEKNTEMVVCFENWSHILREKKCFIYREKIAAITDTKIMKKVILVLLLYLKFSFIGGMEVRGPYSR